MAAGHEFGSDHLVAHQAHQEEGNNDIGEDPKDKFETSVLLLFVGEDQGEGLRVGLEGKGGIGTVDNGVVESQKQFAVVTLHIRCVVGSHSELSFLIYHTFNAVGSILALQSKPIQYTHAPDGGKGRTEGKDEDPLVEALAFADGGEGYGDGDAVVDAG